MSPKTAETRTERDVAALRQRIAQMMLGGTIGGLRLIMPQSAIQAALRAWLDDAEAWKSVEDHALEAAHARGEQLAVMMRLLGMLP